MSFDEVLKAVFPLLDGTDLASCMMVCKQWREIARDDYLWRSLCAKRWPSCCKQTSPPTGFYYKLFQSFNKRQYPPTPLPPRLSFNDLEFYIDIWTEERLMFSEVVPRTEERLLFSEVVPRTEERLLFSEVVPGPVLKNGFRILPPGVSDMLSFLPANAEFRMVLPVEPSFSVTLSQAIIVSVLVGRKDSNKVACIINKSIFDYIDRTANRAIAFDYLDFTPALPFVSGIRAWISLLFMDNGNEGINMDVFRIEMDFCDAANSEEEVLWLLDALDWK